MQFVQTDELMPKEPLVQLPSKSKTGPALFLVHPIEGDVTVLKPVAAQLPCPVWGLQCTSQAPLSSIQKLASFYVQVIYLSLYHCFNK